MNRNWEVLTNRVEDDIRQSISAILTKEKIDKFETEAGYDLEEMITLAADELQEEIATELDTYLDEAIARIQKQIAYEEAIGT